MITQVKFSESERGEFHRLSGMINNISPKLRKPLQEAVGQNELKSLKCALVQLQEDAAKCEVLVDNGLVFLEKQNGKDR